MLGMTSGQTFVFLIVAVLATAAVLTTFAQALGGRHKSGSEKGGNDD